MKVNQTEASEMKISVNYARLEKTIDSRRCLARKLMSAS